MSGQELILAWITLFNTLVVNRIFVELHIAAVFGAFGTLIKS